MNSRTCSGCNKIYDDSKYLYCPRCDACSQTVAGVNFQKNETKQDLTPSLHKSTPDRTINHKEADTAIANTESRFQLNERLGEGSTAIIYSAVDTILNREVVLKVAKGSADEDKPDYRKIFYLEANYYSKLEHPNILPMYDFFEAESGPILVLRQCKSSLADHVVNSSLTIETKLSILSQIASSIDFLREKNIFHRDIKPENILLDDTNSHAYLIDFGISCEIDDKATNNKLIGTPIYMSPETISVGMNNAFIFDEHEQGFNHSDIFSFGVLTYILLSGHLPFNEIDHEKYKNTKWSQSTGFRVLRGEVPIPCSERDTSVPSAANDTVLRMLARSPSDRPSTAQNAIETIRKSYEGKLIDGAKVFLSYSHQDIDIVRPIAEGLSREGLDVWWDDLIGHGKVWDDQIEAALIEADALLVFVSKDSVDSKEAKHEWRYWLEYKEEYPVIPVILDNSRIPYRVAGFQRVYNYESINLTVNDIKQALVSCGAGAVKSPVDSDRTVYALEDVDIDILAAEPIPGDLYTKHKPTTKNTSSYKLKSSKNDAKQGLTQRPLRTDFEIKLSSKVAKIPQSKIGDNITYPKEYLHHTLDGMTIIPLEPPKKDI